MEMVKNHYLTNLHDISTDIERMHMDLESWYQQHTLDSDAHHLNRHMIDIVQKYMRGGATRMKTYIELGALVYDRRSCKGVFARSKLTLEAIRFMHADYYDLPNETCIDTSPNPSNQITKALEKVKLDVLYHSSRPSR